MVRTKKIMAFIFLILILLMAVIYLAKNYILRGILERRLSEINNAPVSIQSVHLSPLDNYITIQGISIMSTLDKNKEFIAIDEFKSNYKVDYRQTLITFNDSEIRNIQFFKNDAIKSKEEIKKEKIDEQSDENRDITENSKIEIFSNKISKTEENQKKEQILSGIKRLYLEKIEIDPEKIDVALQEKYFEIKKIHDEIKEKNKGDYDSIKNSINRLKNLDGRTAKFSDILSEITNITNSSKNILEKNDINSITSIKDKFDEFSKKEEFEDLLDGVINTFLNGNKFVLEELDTYINIYLNSIYEDKIYKVYLKYLSLLDEVKERKRIENEKQDDSWELFFNNIILNSEVYGISFNGEIKNLSSKVSKNNENIEFKLFGEKGQTIGELRGFTNMNKYETEIRLNVPEFNSKDFNSNIFKSGEGKLSQYLYTNNNFLITEGKVDFDMIELNSENIAESLKVKDDLVKELVLPILSEVKTGEVFYKYDTRTRELFIKTNFSKILERIINNEDASLKIKIREKIKEKYLGSQAN